MCHNYLSIGFWHGTRRTGAMSTVKVETRDAVAELFTIRPELAIFLAASRDASCEQRDEVPGLLSSDDACFVIWCVWHAFLKGRV